MVANLLRTAPTRAEMVLAALVLVLGIGEVWTPFSSRQGSGSGVATSVGVVLVALTLLAARRRPLIGMVTFPLAWSVIALVASAYVLFYGQFVPLEICVFMAARFGPGRVPAYAAGLAAVSLLGVDLFVPLMQDPGEIAFHWTVTGLVWSAGFGLRTLDRRAKASMRRAVEAEVGAAEQAMRAVMEERALIAREMHDIVAHAVTSMVVQAGAAESGVDDAEYVRGALATIRATGNEALAEMRRLVSVLRVSDEAPLSPQPRLDALPALVEQASAAGPRTTLSVTGSAVPLPAGLDLALYRIVQEALTNVRRHAAATRCDVSVEYADDSVSVCVVDDGHGTSAAPAGGGHGLVGMRERVAMYGGELVTGARPAGGFEIRAHVPVAR